VRLSDLGAYRVAAQGERMIGCPWPFVASPVTDEMDGEAGATP